MGKMEQEDTICTLENRQNKDYNISIEGQFSKYASKKIIQM